MGPLLPVYVALSALNFQFVTACQDGRLALLFFVLFYYNFYLLLSSLDYCLFLALTLLLARKNFFVMIMCCSRYY